MTVLSGQTISRLGLIQPCRPRTEFGRHIKDRLYTLTHGLGPAGYDLTLDWADPQGFRVLEPGEFRLGAANERFELPNNVIGMVYDKSSWARRGLSLFNTVVEPGWGGWLTIELTNLGKESLFLPQGVPIAQVVFSYLDEPTDNPYNGKYQDQARGPQSAR
jgi:dCTP deaminase